MLEADSALRRAIRRLPDWWLTPLFGAVGGYLASLIGWPLPWIIGSLLAVIAVRCGGCMLQEVPHGRATGQWLIASAIGLHFTHEVMQQVLQHLGVILAGALGTLLLSLIGIFILLRSGTDRAELAALDSILPSGLLELLIGRGLADASVLDDPREALRLGYRFDSYRDRYQAMFAVLKERLDLPQDKVEQWLELPASERQPWIAKADLRASAALLLVEQAALRQQLLQAQEELKKRYLSGRERGDASLAKADGALREILASSGYLSRPAELLDDQGYGLPQAGEWQRLEQQSGERQAHLNQLSEELEREVRLLLGHERRLELDSIERNLKQIGQHLRTLHKAGGGLELP